ncbi:MAG: ferredoxin--NADP reductase [Halobaculum sp.]
MTIRPHKSTHDRIGDLPLVTESARVTDVTTMDRDRRAEVREAVARWLDDAGLADEYAIGTSVSDWRRLHERLAGDGHAELARRVGTLSERAARPKPMLVRTEFETEREFDFLAGQYVGVRYEDAARAYSIASPPTSDRVEICVRRVPDGKLSPRICGDLEVGDRVTLRGPHGDLVLDESSSRDLVFLATGTGVAPFKSMIDYVFEEGLDTVGGEQRDVWLFLGAAWADDLPYGDEFRERAARHDNFHFVPCLSRESILTDWQGETDYVQHALLKHVDPSTVTTAVDERVESLLTRSPVAADGESSRARIDPSEVDVYACGINAMVYGLVAAVRSVGVPETRIESEGFG